MLCSPSSISPSLLPPQDAWSMFPKKTNLLAYTPRNGTSVTYWQEVLPITMAGAALPLTKQAEHVGVLRSTCGTNLPALTSRISAHNKSLYSILSVGMARNHRGNPAASLRVEASCSAPKLFSGLATLNLSRSEQEILSVHRRLTLQQLQRLHPKTPAPCIFRSTEYELKSIIETPI